MKTKNENIRKALTRAEMKTIKGGEDPCPAGKFIDDCLCYGLPQAVLCIPSEGGTKTPFASCNDYCNTRYPLMPGAISAMDCVASCNN